MVARVRCRFSGYGAIANRQTNASASSFFARGTHLAPPRAHGKRNVTSNHPRDGVWGVGLWEMGEIGKYADTAPPALNARTRAAAARSRLRKRKIRENLSLPPTRPLALPKGENFAGLPSPPPPFRPTFLCRAMRGRKLRGRRVLHSCSRFARVPARQRKCEYARGRACQCA